MLCQQAEGDHVVGFPAAHGLRQDEHPLRRLAREAPESLPQKPLHTVGEIVFLEELAGMETAFEQVSQVQDNVPPITVKHTLAGFAELFE
jgi:hypothetical protein